MAATANREDPFDFYTLLVVPLRDGARVGNGATGFVIELRNVLYLVATLHSFTGRDPETNQIVAEYGPPDAELICYHSVADPRYKKGILENLLDSGNPRWMKHPQRDTDVGILPIRSYDDSIVKVYPFDLSLADTNMAAVLGAEVSIIGYPDYHVSGQSVARLWPVHMSGHITEDPDHHDGIEASFSIEAIAPQGMSGAPVIMRKSHYLRRDGTNVDSTAPTTRFLGIYSATHWQKRQGRVWRPKVIKEILQHHRLL